LYQLIHFVVKIVRFCGRMSVHSCLCVCVCMCVFGVFGGPYGAPNTPNNEVN